MRGGFTSSIKGGSLGERSNLLLSGESTRERDVEGDRGLACPLERDGLGEAGDRAGERRSGVRRISLARFFFSRK